MKKVWKFLSYVLVAVLASVLTMALTLLGTGTPSSSKLDQLADLIEERFIGDVDRTAMEDAAADAMVDALGDRWSYYIAADDYQAYADQMSNSYVGIGVTIQVTEDGGFLVSKVTDGGSAQEAGIQVGDRMVAVDGESIQGLSTSVVGAMVKGTEGTCVDITLERDGAELTLSVERRQVQVAVATARLLDDGVGLVTISNFDSRCADETIEAIESLLEQGATSLIFDVRNNPGGYASELVKVLDYLLPEGDLFRTVDYAGHENVDRSDADCLENVPMAVLVNGSSYSAAEFFAAALREYEVAVVVGEPTVGKGYFQVTYKLSDGSAVGLSIGKYFTPKGVSLAEEGGLVPDVLVEVDEQTATSIYAGTLEPDQDPQIQAALEALNP